MENSDKGFDQVTRLVVRAGGIGKEEAERIGSSPFLHARLRAGIDAERRRRAKQANDRVSILLVASRAIAVLIIVMIAALSTFWISKAHTLGTAPPSNATADNVARIVTGGTCALSNTDQCAISTEEVLATLLADKQGEEPK